MNRPIGMKHSLEIQLGFLLAKLKIIADSVKFKYFLHDNGEAEQMFSLILFEIKLEATA